jgi:hypothetical protein
MQTMTGSLMGRPREPLPLDPDGHAPQAPLPAGRCHPHRSPPLGG